jgi:hypothetical protein
MIGGNSRNGMMETVLGLVNDERVSVDILDPLGVLTLYKKNEVKRDLGWPRKEKLVLKNFFFAIGRYNEKREGDVCGLLEIDVFPRKRHEA